MIVGIGVDLVRIERLRAAVARHGDRARRRFFTRRELTECSARPDECQCLSARLAAKEAALKALGTGKQAGVRWTDVEVTRSADGPPDLRFSGVSRERAHALNVRRAWVSLSHEAGVACAVVVLEGATGESG